LHIGERIDRQAIFATLRLQWEASSGAHVTAKADNRWQLFRADDLFWKSNMSAHISPINESETSVRFVEAANCKPDRSI
jgi:hypothetical protein